MAGIRLHAEGALVPGQHACTLPGRSLATAIRLRARQLRTLMPQALKICKSLCHAFKSCAPWCLARADACLRLRHCFKLKHGSSAVVCSQTTCSCSLAQLVQLCCSTFFIIKPVLCRPVSSWPRLALDSAEPSDARFSGPEAFSASWAHLRGQDYPVCLSAQTLSISILGLSSLLGIIQPPTLQFLPAACFIPSRFCACSSWCGRPPPVLQACPACWAAPAAAVPTCLPSASLHALLRPALSRQAAMPGPLAARVAFLGSRQATQLCLWDCICVWVTAFSSAGSRQAISCCSKGCICVLMPLQICEWGLLFCCNRRFQIT